MATWTTARLADIEEISDGRVPWRQVRHHFGIARVFLAEDFDRDVAVREPQVARLEDAAHPALAELTLDAVRAFQHAADPRIGQLGLCVRDHVPISSTRRWWSATVPLCVRVRALLRIRRMATTQVSSRMSKNQQRSRMTSKKDGRFGIDDLTYDLVTILHQKSKGLEAYQRYIDDARTRRDIREMLQQIDRASCRERV